MLSPVRRLVTWIRRRRSLPRPAAAPWMTTAASRFRLSVVVAAHGAAGRETQKATLEGVDAEGLEEKMYKQAGDILQVRFLLAPGSQHAPDHRPNTTTYAPH